MFQPLTRKAAFHRAVSKPALNLCIRPHAVPVAHRLHPRFLATSPLPPSAEKPASLAATNTLPITARKATTDFRPAPRKSTPSTFSATHAPSKPTQSPWSKEPSPKVSLNSAKEAAIKDIEDAESHGVLTPPPPDANWFKRTLHKAIQLAKFYYRGVKLIFLRRRDIAAIQARIRAGGAPLSRWENRLIRTQKDDINKVIPFLFIALLLEEVIPLIAIYAPFMLPSTCVLPSQRARIQEKKAEKATAYASHYRQLFAHLEKSQNPVGHLSLGALRGGDGPLAVCGLLRLTTTGFDLLRLRRIRKHLEFISTDDQLLLQNSALEQLSDQELTEALEERGFLTQGLDSKSKMSRLRWWLSTSTLGDDNLSRRLYLLVKNV